MTVLGIDLGTSQVKALLADPNGRPLAQASAAYPVSTPRPGWAETDPALWWRAVRTAVTCLGPARAEASAIAVTGQMHGLILISERTSSSRPAILWLDRRAVAEAGDYRKLPPDQLAALGNAPSPGMAGPILLWLSRHEPAAYQSATWQLQPKDWLRLRLTGEPATDPTDASGTLLYDITRDTWATQVAETLGLRTDLLPPIRPSAAPAGELLPDVAADLGLPPGIPVATGCADTAASLLAATSLANPHAAVPASAASQWALLTLGTGGQWIAPISAPTPDPTGRTNLFRAVSGWYRLAAAQNVGVTLDWVRRTLDATWDDLYAAAAPTATPPQAVTMSAASLPPPLFDPRLVAERWDAEAAGKNAAPGAAWTGLHLGHTREDLLRAALTGVAVLLRDRLGDLRAAGSDPAHVLLAGGGAAHPAWHTLLVEVLGIPLIPTSTPWLTVTGATHLASGG